MFDTSRGDRAQIGAGTIVILIAVLIVAATTAGVLFNVTGLLESRADSTGEAVSSEIEDPLQVVAVTGRVNETADPRTLAQVRLIVSPDGASPGVDLSEATVRLRTPDGTDSLRYDPTGPREGEQFAITALTDPDGSAPVLTEGDSFAILIDTPPLGPHDAATVEIQLQSGATKTVPFRVPDRIRSQAAVSLD